jgi:hypothetical protein
MRTILSWLHEGGNGKHRAMPTPTFEELLEAMRDSVEVLQNRGLLFALGGGLAAWAWGGPRSEHDVDLIVAPDQAEDAVGAFAERGLRVERPPEGWLFKAWHPNGVLVDIIFEPSGGSYTREELERVPLLDVAALRIRVLPTGDIIASKLLALTEQSPDFRDVLELARALREQIDWASLEARTEGSPFAAAFFTLAEGLGIKREPADVARTGDGEPVSIHREREPEGHASTSGFRRELGRS